MMNLFKKKKHQEENITEFYRNLLPNNPSVEEIERRECENLVKIISDKIINKEYEISYFPEFSRYKYIKINIGKYSIPYKIKVLEIKEFNFIRETRTVDETSYSYINILKKVEETIKNKFEFSEVKLIVFSNPDYIDLYYNENEIYTLYFRP